MVKIKLEPCLVIIDPGIANHSNLFWRVTTIFYYNSELGITAIGYEGTVSASRMRATASACVALPPICTHRCVGPCSERIS